ncbi:MAG: glycosyltransferase [Clostridium sartagoforme]|nr:glycosyltransferase [Clostridium sartagoforme]
MDNNSIKQRLNTLIKLRKELRNLITEEEQKIKEYEKSIGIAYDKSNKEILNSIKELNRSKVDYKCKEVKVDSMDIEKKKNYLQKRDKLSDIKFIDRIKHKLDNIPVSNGSRYYSKLDINIGIIADEFLYNSFKDIANFIYITPKNYKEQVKNVELLFVASTWNGLNKEWCGVATPNSKVSKLLLDVIKYYKENNIKCVFYSKEDPINYDLFLDYAKASDYIFTTENDVVENYKYDCQNDNVKVLSFGINPIYHNPIGFKSVEKEKGVLFAGSWYEKYPDRNKETKMLFDGVVKSGKDLKIIDRNFSISNERYFFPEEYLKYISPEVEHSNLQKIHKLYDWALNLNTIKYSTSMFANRVYELQALGNILISNYNLAINNKFPNVFLVTGETEVSDILNGFNEEEIYRQQITGIRMVMSKETTYDRLKNVLEVANIKKNISDKSIAVLVKNINQSILDMFNKQTYENKELILVDEFNDDLMNQYDMITFFNDNSEYGMYYLENMINAFKYTDSDYITKNSYYSGKTLVNGKEHNYTDLIIDKYRTVFWSSSFTLNQLINLKNNSRIENGYSIDRFDFNEKIESNFNKFEEKEYKISVIIAAYNNGKHLLNKCFNSLRRSSIFNEMEIIIVDDGSTDNYTQDVVKYIDATYKNVKTYLYNDGGSGSASRPRNKGFEMSTSKYITYLDPDNEAINDGYKVLYDNINGTDLDLVIGGMDKLDTSQMGFNYHNVMLTHNNRKDILTGDKKEFLIKSKFYVMSIQALLFKRELIEKNNLKMIEGVFGEDTIFFQELLLCADKVKAIDLYIHIYYAAVEGSSVNAITKKFYERYLTLEELRIYKYKQYDLMDGYIKTRFDFYVTRWYFDKLTKVKEEDAVDSIKILEKILDLYKPFVEFTEPQIIQFYKLCKEKKYNDVVDIFIKDKNKQAI